MEATDAEVALVQRAAAVSLDALGAGGRLSVPIALTASGSVTIPAYSFTPQAFAIDVQDVSNFNYSFVYRP